MFMTFWFLIVAVSAHHGMDIVNDIESDELRKPNKSSLPLIRKQVKANIKSIKWSDVLLSTEEGLVISEKHFTRESWCRSKKYYLNLAIPGCNPRKVQTRFCFGQCNSFFIPRLDGIFESCPTCRASKGSWFSPSISCGKRQIRPIKVYRVKNCKCLPIK